MQCVPAQPFDPTLLTRGDNTIRFHCISEKFRNENSAFLGSRARAVSKQRKKGDWLCFSPLQYVSLPPGTLRGVCPCLWSRRSGPGPATAEAQRRLRLRGSHMDLADRLSPAFPRSCALSRGSGSPRCGFFPVLSESPLLQQFVFRGDWYCFYNRVGRALLIYIYIVNTVWCDWQYLNEHKNIFQNVDKTKFYITSVRLITWK